MMRVPSRFLALLTLLTLLLTTTSVATAAYGPEGVATAAARMRTLGVVKGDASGDLKLNATITRAEMMTIIVRAYGQEEQAKLLKGSPTGFPDVDNVSHWGAPYILMAKRLIDQKGSTIGVPGGGFNPDGNLTAAEAIAFQMKFLGVQPKAGLNWPDNFIQGAVDGGLLDKDDATVIDPIKNAPATRGLAFYLADRAFSDYKLPESGKTVYQTHVDTTPPTVTVDPTYPAESRDGNVTLTGSATDATEVRVAGVPATLADGRWQATVRLGVGRYTVAIDAADAADNIGKPAQPVVITYHAAPALAFIRDGTIWAADMNSLTKPFQVSPKGATVLSGNYDAYNEPVVTTDGRWVYYTRLRSLNGVATKAIVRSSLDPAATEQVAEVVLEFPADQGVSDLDLAPGGGILFERGGNIYRIQGTGVQMLTGARGYTKPTAGSGNWLLATARSEVKVQDFSLPNATVAAVCGPTPRALTGGDTRVVHQDPAALPDGSGFIFGDTLARRLVVRPWQGEPRTLQFKGLYDDRVDAKPTLSADGTLAFETAMGGPLRIVVVPGVNSDEPVAQFEGRDPSWGRFVPAAATPGPCGADAAAAPQWEKADLGVKVTARVDYVASPEPKPTVKAATSPAAAPTITSQPAGATVNVGQSASLSVTATGTGTLSYQWYGNATNSNSGGTAIDSATDATYAAPTTTAGETYYYVVVTNTDENATGNQAAITTSSAVLVKVNASRPIITTIAGTGSSGSSGDGGPAKEARLNNPYGVAIDGSGNLYIADTTNNRIRKVAPDGTISTVAGTGTPGYSGDGGPAVQARLNNPSGIAADSSGNLYIADRYNNRIRKVAPDGTISTVAGTGSAAYSGDGGPAAQAPINSPTGVTLDSSGNLYIADRYNNRIRKVAPDGTISTVAGTGSSGISGDGGPAEQAQLYWPFAVVLDSSGNLYISDYSNHGIRKVAPDGTISTVAGTGASGSAGDGGQGVQATLNNPSGIAMDGAGNLYVALYGGNSVRKIALDGTISTVAGTGVSGYSGDGGPADKAQVNRPLGVAVDGNGNVYIADTFNHRIRQIALPG